MLNCQNTVSEYAEGVIIHGGKIITKTYNCASHLLSIAGLFVPLRSQLV